MANTTFKEIYEQNEVVKNDQRLLLKPTNLIYKLYYDYLKKSIGLFWRDCYQDIKNHTPFSQEEYLFIVDGIDNEFLLSPVPTNSSNIYVGYAKDANTAYTEIPSSDYTYDADTNVISIDLPSLPSEGSLLYISMYEIGMFNVELETDEQDILVEGMLIRYLEEQQNKNTLLNYMVYGGSQKAASQGEHLKQVHTVVVDQERKVNDLITKYSYRADPNKLSSLGVRT